MSAVKTEVEVLYSLDVESAGTVPGRHTLFSIGLEEIETREQIYVEMWLPEAIEWEPSTWRWWHDDPEARLEIDSLLYGKTKVGRAEAAEQIQGFVADTTKMLGLPEEYEILHKIVAWPASFDKPFLDVMFWDVHMTNPFHHMSIDLSSYCLGKFGVSRIPDSFRVPSKRPHHALHDASAQAEMYRNMRDA